MTVQVIRGSCGYACVYNLHHILVVTVDDVFVAEYVVLFKRFMRPKVVGIGCHRLLLVTLVGVELSTHRRFSLESRTGHRCQQVRGPAPKTNILIDNIIFG